MIFFMLALILVEDIWKLFIEIFLFTAIDLIL
jgi:hypothetical protein